MNQGKCFETGSSNEIVPSRTSEAIVAEVNALVHEPMGKSVSAETGFRPV